MLIMKEMHDVTDESKTVKKYDPGDLISLPGLRIQ